jgi:alpha-N-arabinofuranosidase
LQGIGHGDLIEDYNGNWWILTLGFRQIHQWLPFHHLGREICLTPVTFDDELWFTAGDGTTSLITETDRISSSVTQKFKTSYTFENTPWNSEWQFLRSYDADNYVLGHNSLQIKSNDDTLDKPGSPAFIGLHQKEFDMELLLHVKVLNGEAGICIYMNENHHYDLALIKEGDTYNITLKLNIGDIKHRQAIVEYTHNEVIFKIRSNAINYEFMYCDGDNEISLGNAQTRYLSSEVASSFTGVMLGLYSQGGAKGLYNEFSGFSIEYKV